LIEGEDVTTIKKEMLYFADYNDVYAWKRNSNFYHYLAIPIVLNNGSKFCAGKIA